MDNFLDILLHSRRLQANTKELSVKQLQHVISTLNKIIEKRESEESQYKERQQERLLNIASIKKQMDAIGLSINELDTNLVSQVKKRAPRPAKYSIVVDGEQITWTGQGRMPNVFKRQIENHGKQLEDFTI